MKILIGADVVPTSSNEDLFVTGDAEELVGRELKELLSAADYRIFNLEVPLTDQETPIDKCGPNLIAPTATINGYKAIGSNLLTLANNHILDQGLQGMESTCNLLSNNGIAYFGVGNTLAEAAKPYILSDGERSIGVYACAEHEFSIVTKTEPGANPFDPLESLDHIADLKHQCDYVIVLYHGGKEHYRYPSPNLQQVCRKMVQKGADLVICQHTHCVGCEEKYLHGTIVYGQGNFLFDYSNSEYWQTSLLVSVDDEFNVTYVPLEKKNNVVRLATGETAKAIMNGFVTRSDEIKVDGVIEKNYLEFAHSMLHTYLFNFSGIRRGFFLKVCNKLTNYKLIKWAIRKRYTPDKKMALQNFIECEAHRELLLYALKNKR